MPRVRLPLGPVIVFLVFAAPHGEAQQLGREVRVEYVAGGNLYLRVGADLGIRTGDTVAVYREQGGALLGAFVVISATSDRSVVTFAGDPFPVTRGAVLYIIAGRGGAVEVGERPPPEHDRPRALSASGPRASGRLSFDVAALKSTTRWVADEPVEVNRQFVTPTMSLRTAVADLPGGIRFDANVRAAYRYSAPLVVDPAPSVRVYRASVAKRFAQAPLQVEAGRLFNVFDPYGGYLDGVLLRIGRESVGAGVTAGFEPVRGNESFSSELPKYSAFGNATFGSQAVRYATEVSLHRVDPKNGLVSRTYAGWSQRFTWRRVSVSQELQLDRMTSAGDWTITRLRVRGSLPLAGPIEVSGRYAADRPFDPVLGDTVPLPRQEQIGAGLSYAGRGVWIGADVTNNQGEAIESSYTYSGSLNVPRTPLAGVGLSVAASFFDQPSFRSVQWSGGLSRSFGSLYARVSYLEYRTESITRRFDSHAADIALLSPLNDRVRLSLLARTQWGENLLMQSLNVGLWTTF